MIGATANDLRPGVRLELQDYTGAAGQIWAFDGDTFILKANRSLVAEVQNGRTPRGTAVVLGGRDLDDAEFWRLIAVDGTDKKPTSGFVRVPQETDLRTALKEASWGTVIEIDSGALIPLDDCSHPGACPAGQTVPDFPLQVPGGVTLRGNRHGTASGPMLTMSTYPWNTARTIDIVGHHARMTGLRLGGPSPDTDDDPELSGVFINDDEIRYPILDHNEMYGWTIGAVQVEGRSNLPADYTCTAEPARPRTARVVANFVHHNARAGLGYGVVLGSNGFAKILRNTFLYNRHAIAADGLRATGYTALFNLVLSDAPEYGWSETEEHDFDMHGAEENDDSNHEGGIAGSDVDITRNTFLGRNPAGPDTRYNYDVRGTPCAPHRFHSNVSVESQPEAIHWYGQPSPTAPPPPWFEVSNNHFNSDDPTGNWARATSMATAFRISFWPRGPRGTTRRAVSPMAVPERRDAGDGQAALRRRRWRRAHRCAEGAGIEVVRLVGRRNEMGGDQPQLCGHRRLCRWRL